jgi:hypothetical protein
MASSSGDGDGIELKVTEAPDNSMSRFSSPTGPICGAFWKTGPLRFEKTGTGKRKATRFANFYCFHGHYFGASAKIEINMGRVK